MKTWIPKAGEWSFKNRGVASNFDKHVREQLPWYELATRAVAHFGRHYIPKGGLVYDVGASTGNIGRALEVTLRQRHATLIAIEESQAMLERYVGPGKKVCENAMEHEYVMFDFMVCFLSYMFLPTATRREWLRKMESMTKPGGALLIVDKLITPPEYAGTVIRRLAMAWKYEAGVSSDEILQKELSLAGAQRPVDPTTFMGYERFFQFGEFVGVIKERRD